LQGKLEQLPTLRFDSVPPDDLICRAGIGDEPPVAFLLWGDVMVSDPKECRKHAARCAEMAVAARTPQLKTTFLELSKNWEKLAIQLENAFALLDQSEDYTKETKPLSGSPVGYAIPKSVPPSMCGSRAPALVIQVPGWFPRAVGRDLVGPVEQLGVDAIAFD
jgi:hypothetical protein